MTTPPTYQPVGGRALDILASATHISAPAFSDSVDLNPLPYALYFGAAGNVTLLMPDGSTALFIAVAGVTLPVGPVRRIMATGTNVAAGSIVALAHP